MEQFLNRLWHMEPAAGPSVNECGTDRCETKDSEPVENETTTKWYQTTEDDEEWKTDLDKMLEGSENAKIWNQITQTWKRMDKKGGGRDTT